MPNPDEAAGILHAENVRYAEGVFNEDTGETVIGPASYDRELITMQDREDFLDFWGYTPPIQRAWAYFAMSAKFYEAPESMTDHELLLVAFAPNDEFALRALELDPQFDLAIYRDTVYNYGNAEELADRMMERYPEKLIPESDFARDASSFASTLARRLGIGAATEFISDHTGATNIDPRQSQASRRNIVEGAAFQDLGRIPSMRDGFDDFIENIDAFEKGVGGVIVAALALRFGWQAVVPAGAPVRQKAAEWWNALQGSTAVVNSQQFGRTADSWVGSRIPSNQINQPGMQMMQWVSYQTGRPIDAIAYNMYNRGPLMDRGANALMRPGTRNAARVLGLIFGHQTYQVYRQLNYGDEFDADQRDLIARRQADEELTREDIEGLKVIDARVQELGLEQQIERGATLGEVFDRNKEIEDDIEPQVEYEGDIGSLFDSMWVSPNGEALSLSEQETQIGSFFDGLQQDTDEQAQAANDTNWLRNQWVGAGPGVYALGGAERASLSSILFQTPPTLDGADAEPTQPPETYGQWSADDILTEKQREDLEQVGAGTVSVTSFEEHRTARQEATQAVMDQIEGAEWFPDDLSPDEEEDLYTELDAGGYSISPAVTDPVSDAPRQIIIPPGVTLTEFWEGVEFEISNKGSDDPYIGVSEDYRSYRWTPNLRSTPNMDIYEREFLSQAQPGIAESPYMRNLLWDMDGYNEPQFRHSAIEDMMASMGPSQVFKFQELARDAGFYDSTGGRFAGGPGFAGHLTFRDEQIIETVMRQVNIGDDYINRTFWSTLEHWATQGKAAKKLQDANQKDPFGRLPFSVPAHLRHIPGDKTVAQETKARFRDKMGRDPRPDELKGIAAELTGYHETSNREQMALYLAAYNGDNGGLLTGADLKKIEEPGAATSFDIEDKWANEIDLNKRRESNSQSFGRMLNATLGGRSQIGQASAAGSVTQIGRE